MARSPGWFTLRSAPTQAGLTTPATLFCTPEFDTQRSLDGYAAHPEHLRVRAELDGVRIRRHQVDYPVGE